MTRLAGFALMLAAALVQVTWAPRLGVYGAFPNLVLAATVCVTWLWGPRSGLAWACAGGLLLDLTAPGPLGPHALALLAGAYLTGFWVRNVDPASLLQPALATATATAVYSLVLVAADDTLGLPVPPLHLAVQLAVAAAAYNAVLVPPALMLARRMRRAPARAA
jgi:rod shape-determining protein MreD